MLSKVEEKRSLLALQAEDCLGSSAYPNLRHIRLLDRAATCGSLSRAAAEVHVSQPAATQAIARLEKQFGVQLLARGSNGISLTDRGALVVGRLRRALQHLRNANRELARSSRDRSVPVEILETHSTVAHLRALAAFAETGSFGAAGRLLGQAESSVHRAARQFERIAGVPLFEERSRQLRLTSCGRSVAMHANLFLAEISSAHEELREFEGSFSGRVRIGTLPLVRTSIIPMLVASVSARYPQASLEISDGDYDSQVRALSSGRLDMVVGALRAGLDDGLCQRELFRDSLSVIAGRGHPLLELDKVDRDHLMQYPWVVPREGTPTRAIFERLGLGDAERKGSTPPPIIAGSSVVIRGILLETDRLAILSPGQVEHELRAGLLEVVRYPLEDTERRIGLTLREGWQPTMLQRTVIQILEALCEEQPLRASGKRADGGAIGPAIS